MLKLPSSGETPEPKYCTIIIYVTKTSVFDTPEFARNVSARLYITGRNLIKNVRSGEAGLSQASTCVLNSESTAHLPI